MNNQCDMIVISGLSGAGKSSAIKVIEDIGYNTIDNVPLEVVEGVANIFYATGKPITKIALVIDSRSKDSSLAFTTIKMLKDRYNAKLIFMDALPETIIKRYKETRHTHPQGKDLLVAINDEIEIMSDIKSIADYIYISDNKSVHELAFELKNFCDKDSSLLLSLSVQSFGFKYGVPIESDLIFDVRFLKNPYFDPELKKFNGRDKVIDDFIVTDKNYQLFLDKLVDMLRFLLPLYIDEGKKYLNISIGCTGGKHRSVMIVENLAKKISDMNLKIDTMIKHRDIDK